MSLTRLPQKKSLRNSFIFVSKGMIDLKGLTFLQPILIMSIYKNILIYLVKLTKDKFESDSFVNYLFLLFNQK